MALYVMLNPQDVMLNLFQHLLPLPNETLKQVQGDRHGSGQALKQSMKQVQDMVQSLP